MLPDDFSCFLEHTVGAALELQKVDDCTRVYTELSPGAQALHQHRDSLSCQRALPFVWHISLCNVSGEEHCVLSISQATIHSDTLVSRKELDGEVRGDILKWEKDLGGVGRKGEEGGGGTWSILLFHWKDTACHNELLLICTSSTVRLRPASNDDKQHLQDHIMRGQGCFTGAASLN